MTDKNILQNWVVEALNEMGGRAKIVDICKKIWEYHERDLKQMGDLFYTWQYDIRWAAHKLKSQERLRYDKIKQESIWILT